MKVKLQRLTSALVAIVLAFGMIVSSAPAASASEAGTSSGYIPEIDYLPYMVINWESTFSTWGTSILGEFYEETYYAACWNAIDKCFSGYIGSCARLAALQNKCTFFNNAIKSEWTASTLLYGLAAAGKYPVVQVAYVSSLGVYTLVDVNTGLVLVNSSGAYTWYKEDSTSSRQDQWLDFSTAIKATKVSVLTADSLSDLCLTLNQTDRTCSVRNTFINGQRFYIIIDGSNNIYANADGVPYVAHYDATATDLEYDYIVNEGDTIDNSQVIDLSNGTFNYIDESGKQEFYVDELVYDFSSQSYSADTYNIIYDNDTYNTYNYTWNITYNITNTYVTNIGQTVLYEPLELYYELPDGRSSADLTAEEVVGMSFEFADCVNYEKSATDTYLRALYHFDGNTADSSYFSTQGNFEWVKGASIEYMDVGTFGGALYLGPEEHQFDVVLPDNMGSGDFTIQFRYFQSSVPDTETNYENSLKLGNTSLLIWDESSIYLGSLTPLASLTVGSWQELAVMRLDKTLYLYHNGLCIGSFPITARGFTDTLTFTLGSSSRAYSMIDELRVVNKALFTDGDSSSGDAWDQYTPTSVPYDTNAVLVLPDLAYPIADEYWSVTSSHTNLLPFTVDDFTDGVGPAEFIGSSFDVEYYAPEFVYDPDYISLWAYNGFLRLSNDSASDYSGLQSVVYVYDVESSAQVEETIITGYGTYCFSVLLSDGSVYSLPFTPEQYDDPQTAYFDWGQLIYSEHGVQAGYFSCQIAIVPNPGSYVDIVYLELIEGFSTDLSGEWITCMYSSEDVKPNTAAIQTDIPIHGYTVGGVRPTFPVRGDIWMPVSGNRISGCYLYNGSAWEQVNARWYTGTRWIPIYAFDLTTLKDCWDIADVDKVHTQIGSETDFWNWWRDAWYDFVDRFNDSGGFGGGSGDSSASDETRTTIKDVLSGLIDEILGLITEVLKSLISAAGDLLSGIFAFLTDTVLGGVKNFFTALTDGFFLDGFRQTDENGNVTTELPDGIAGVFAFFSSLFMLMPVELRSIMLFGFAAILMLAVFKMIKV